MMVVHENYYKVRRAEHDEIRTTVKKMIKDWGLKISINGGFWLVHKDPWYTIEHNRLISVCHMGFRLVPEVTCYEPDYNPLAEQIAEYLDRKVGTTQEDTA